MKKTVSVNIKGINFLIEEDAYELLDSYFKRLTLCLKNEKDSKEIIDDIEYRISELCSLVLTSNKQVVEYQDVDSILKTLGQPEEFVEDQIGTVPIEEVTEDNPSSKKFFRDVENGKIAGVCSGLSSYFSIDVIFVRIILLFLFFFGGFGFPFYIIIWIITPKATSSIDRLRMRGKKITIDSVKDEVETAANRMKYESKSFANKLRKDGELSTRMRSIVAFFRVMIGIWFVVCGFSALIMTVVFGFFNQKFIPINRTVYFHSDHLNLKFNSLNMDSDFLSLSGVNELFIENSSDFFWLKSLGIIIGLSIFLFSIVLGVKLIFNLKNKWLKLILVTTFLVGIFSFFFCIYFSAKSGSQLTIEGEIERKIADVNTSELIVQSFHQQTIKQNDFVVKSNGFDGVFTLDGNRIKNTEIKFVYRISKDSLYHVYQQFSARAISHQFAIEKAKHIQHKISVSDSLLSIDTDYSYPKKDKIRSQSVTIIIEIPKGKTVKFPNHTVSLDTRIDEEFFEEPFYEEEGVLNKNGEYEHWD